MANVQAVAVPDIGDFAGVPIIELLVAVGDTIAVEDPIVELESDKASFEVPSPVAGVVKEVKVAIGDKVAEGSVLILVETTDAEGAAKAPDETPGPEAAQASAETTSAPTEVPAPAAAPAADFERGEIHAQVLVLGAGPGGYSAAFRAADLGLDVVLVERHETLGGVCLNVGCIPSKALLHVAKVMAEAEEVAAHGITYGEPQIDLDQLRGFKEEVVGKLTQGVAGMAKRRKVRVVTGEAQFTGPHTLTVSAGGEEPSTTTLSFDRAILAAGSTPVKLPGIPADDPRVWDSTDALELREIPAKLLVIGGGIIGLEMATVYDALGSQVTVVELAGGLIPGCDRDLVKPLQARISERYAAIHLKTKAEAVEAKDDGLHVTFGGDGAPEPAVFDAVLVAVGRTPNGRGLGLETAGVTVDERGFVPVDAQLRTNVGHILGIGDLVGGPMLAHKASHEAHVAAEVIAGHAVAFDVRGIPSVAYTDPEVAWVGLTETEAAANGTACETAVFPWAASGRAIAIGGTSGRTKLLFDPATRRVLGGGAVGPNAGELMAEIGLAVEMGADVGDLALTVHAHPTLSETVGLAAEVAEGTVTDLPPARKKR